MAKQRDIITAIVTQAVSNLSVGEGESAYDIAVRLGYSGTEEQWIASLHGTNATITKESVEAVLTGEVSTHSHQGGTGGLTQAQILTRQL